MIPNIIHYCWFSGEEMPVVVKDCISSWHRYMPDYEYRLWDMKAIEEIDSQFLREAIEARKWAFAADYVRLWAVEKYGGIYLDTDMELYSSLEPFRSDRMFIGMEQSPNMLAGRPWSFLTAHIFGAEAHHPFLQDCMEYYKGRHFLVSTSDKLPEKEDSVANHKCLGSWRSGADCGSEVVTKPTFRRYLGNGLRMIIINIFKKMGYVLMRI
ncbi:MAG: hypothetical protein HFJ95_05215 [Muribaculaceae bacterium]|nr:hypothetical protein [Muribaculaceae bacterium]